MPAKNKLRGNALEKQIVKSFLDKGIEAKRAWGSNGESMGMHAEVDVVATLNTFYDFTASERVRLKIQAKKKKKLPNWMGFTEHVDAVVVAEDYGKKYIMFELNDFIDRFM